MLKNRTEQIQSLTRLTDAILCVSAFFGAYWIRSVENFGGPAWSESVGSLSWMLGVSLVIHLVLYDHFQFYSSLRLKAARDIVRMVVQAGLSELFILGSLVFFFQAKDTSRYFFAIFLLLNYSLVLLEKLGARVLLSSIRRRGYNYRHVLIVGTGPSAVKVIHSLRKNPHWGYLPAGLLSEHTEMNAAPTGVEGVAVWGDLLSLKSIVKTKPVDELFIALDRLDPTEIGHLLDLAEKLGIPARLSLAMFQNENSKFTFSTFDSLPIITFYTTLMTPAQAFIKRAMDIIIALIGLLITGILYPWITYRIRQQSPGPVLFKQVRVGENGRRFKCYKFRTMYLDAESRKKELLEHNQMDGPIFKIDRDPRVFSFGAFLRKTSLDELPQFINILRGDMSVVGTRPPTPDEVERYRTHYRRRLSIRPGLTGLWQVSGRSQITRFEDILALDLKYIDDWSIWLDIRIICQTMWVAIFRRGAH